jgi:hypothetical protein
VRVKPGEHAVERVLDKIAVIDRIDVFRAHPLEHVAEQVEQLIGFDVSAVLGPRRGEQGNAQMPGQQARRRAECRAGHKRGAQQQPCA